MSIQPKHRAPVRYRARRVLTVTATAAVLAVGAGAALSSGAWWSGSVPDDSAAAPSAASTAAGTATAPSGSDESAQPVDVATAVKIAKEKATEPLPDLSKMDMAQLQDYSAKMQAEFVQASLAYQQAQTQAEQATQAAQVAEDKSAAAAKDADRARSMFAEQVADTYASGVVADPMIKVLAGGPSSVKEFADDYNTVEQVTSAQAITAEEMTTISDKAATLADHAADLEGQAHAARSQAQVLLDDIQGRAAKVAAAANKALADSADGRTLFASAEQAARNKAALRDWRAYLTLLDRAHVVPPAARDLADPASLPRGLSPLAGAHRSPVVGVAATQVAGRTVTVLPRETIAAVSRAFAAVGMPYVAGNDGPDTYDCSGLTSAVWATTKYRLPATDPVDQFRVARRVPLRNIQVGDLVFFADAADGIQQVGVNLGGDLMLAADATSQQVGVLTFPGKPVSAARVTLPREGKNPAPDTTRDSPLRCGGSPVPASASGMLYPMDEGTYTFTATFGEPGDMWASGYHTGLDFAAPVGSAVHAAKGGVVTVSHSSWGGPNFVTIDHGDGLQTAYAHMSQAVVKTGDVVAAGDLIGAVGAEGNVTGPHLHFEVIVGGVKVDPMLFLAGEGAGAVGWGGYANGMIPASALCPLTGAPGHLLRCDAAAAWNAMAAAYQKSWGSPLCITDSYRSYAVQVTTYARKPSLAAVPGTSNHGWALAVDLCGGIERYDTKQYAWMVAHAPQFGWVHPDWARQGGGREEPWHWEFGNIS